MLSQEVIDDLHEFAEKLLAEQESEQAKKSFVNKSKLLTSTSELDSIDDYPVTSSYQPQTSYVAKSN